MQNISFDDNLLGMPPHFYNAFKSCQFYLNEVERLRGLVRANREKADKYKGKPLESLAWDAVNNAEKAAEKAFKDYLHFTAELQKIGMLL